MHDHAILGIALAALIVAAVALDVRAFLRERREAQARAEVPTYSLDLEVAEDWRDWPEPTRIEYVDLAMWELEMSD